MAKKKSVKRTARQFKEAADDLKTYCEDAKGTALTAAQISLVYEGAIIKTYAAFEDMILGGLVGAINNNTAILSETVHVDFPKHLTDEVCEYIIRGDGYFDFRGRDGLIREVRRYVPEGHYLLDAVKKAKYKDAIDRLCAFRNYAAHDSAASKRAVLRLTGRERIGSAGSYLKSQQRFEKIVESLTELAREIEDGAPY